MGGYQDENENHFFEPALLGLTPGTAQPLGTAFVPRGAYGMSVVASTRSSRWLMLFADDDDRILARPLGPDR